MTTFRLDVALRCVAEERVRGHDAIVLGRPENDLHSLFHAPILHLDQGKLGNEHITTKMIYHLILHRLVDHNNVCIIARDVLGQDMRVEIVSESNFGLNVAWPVRPTIND